MVREVKRLLLIAFFGIAVGVCSANAAEKVSWKVNWPENWWGGELPIPIDNNTEIEDISIGRTYISPAGEIYVGYILQFANGMKSSRVFNLFKEEVEFESSYKGRNYQETSLKRQEFTIKKKLIEVNTAVFKDVKIVSHVGSRYLTHGIQLINDTLENNRKLVVVVSKKQKIKTKSFFEPDYQNFNNNAQVHSIALYPQIYNMKDGSYLLKSHHHPYIIRLKQDFTSPYLENHHELYASTPEEMYSIYKPAYEKALKRYPECGFKKPLLNCIDEYVTEELRTRMEKRALKGSELK